MWSFTYPFHSLLWHHLIHWDDILKLIRIEFLLFFMTKITTTMMTVVVVVVAFCFCLCFCSCLCLCLFFYLNLCVVVNNEYKMMLVCREVKKGTKMVQQTAYSIQHTVQHTPSHQQVKFSSFPQLWMKFQGGNQPIVVSMAQTCWVDLERVETKNNTMVKANYL